MREENVSKKAEASVKRGFWNAVKETAHEIFIHAALALIERSVKWLLKNLPSILRSAT